MKEMDDAIAQYFLGNKNFYETITEMWRIYNERPEHCDERAEVT